MNKLDLVVCVVGLNLHSLHLAIAKTILRGDDTHQLVLFLGWRGRIYTSLYFRAINAASPQVTVWRHNVKKM